MAEPAVVNASPLIFLSKSNRLELLRLISPEVVVSGAVVAEIEEKDSDNVTAQAVRDTSWISVVETPEVPPVIQAWDLGDGESSVLAWAYQHPDTEVIIDDLAARRCAASLSVPVRGTLGIVLVAKQRGEIPVARSVMEELRRHGMYLSDAVLSQALALVGGVAPQS